MGSDNGHAPPPSFSAGRFVRMAVPAIVFLVFVANSGKEDNSGVRGSVVNVASNHDHYNHFHWRELPREIQKEALHLGYTARSWDNSAEDPPAFNKKWADLNPSELNAALAFGYNEKEWCAEDASDSSDEATEAPAQPRQTDATAGGEKNDAPAGGEKTDAPTSGEKTDAPAGGEKNDAPAGGEKNDSPAGGEKKDAPAGGEKKDAPAGGEKKDAPAGGEKKDAPAGGKDTDAPAGGEGSDKASAGEGGTTAPSNGNSSGGSGEKS